MLQAVTLTVLLAVYGACMAAFLLDRDWGWLLFSAAGFLYLLSWV